MGPTDGGTPVTLSGIGFDAFGASEAGGPVCLSGGLCMCDAGWGGALCERLRRSLSGVREAKARLLLRERLAERGPLARVRERPRLGGRLS